MTGRGFRAVLFDWRRTTVHDDLSWWIPESLVSVGRPADAATVTSIERRVIAAFDRPEYLELERTMDRSADLHREGMMTIFGWAGLDDDLATVLYEQDFKSASHLLYPDVVETLEAIRALGAGTALLSNIHFDLRPELREQGIIDLFDSVVLSYEQGIQKPDPRLFQMALDDLDVEPTEALMVGDSPTNDGGGVELGITTLILPPQQEFGPRGLDIVVDLLHRSADGG
jgi:HAD superfamily hydrolase (TIGR01509 family)